MNIALLMMVTALIVVALGGAVFAFAGMNAEKTKKRVAALSRPTVHVRAVKGAGDSNQARRKNVQTMLKEMEKQHAQVKKRPSLRRRIEQAGLTITIRTYWLMAAGAGVAAAIGTFLTVSAVYAAPLAGFAFTFGFPRW